MKKAVLFICVLISIYSCGTKKNESDLDKAGLKGDVIFVLPDSCSYINPIMEFDNNGNVIRKIDYFEYEKKITLTEITYDRDSSNKVIGENEVIYSDNNQLQYYAIRKKYKYDHDKLITINYQDKFYSIIEKYKYEDDKLVEMKKELHAKSKKLQSSLETTSYYYTKNNDLDSTVQIRFKEDGELESKYINTYLQNGLLRSEKEYSKMSNNTISISIRELMYNDKNDLIEEKITDYKGTNSEATRIKKFNYIYDDKNNWIEKTTKHIDLKINDDVAKRRIFYRGQNYSEFITKYDLFIIKYKSSSIELKESSSQSQLETNLLPIIKSQNDESQVYKNSSQEQQEDRRACYQCNGTGQCPKCSKPQRVRYKQGEYPNDHYEIRLGMIVCSQCGGNLMNWGADKNKSCYLCKASGWLLCSECNHNYGNGSNIGKCQMCKGSGFLID